MDGITVAKFESQAEAELQKLGEQLSTGRYTPDQSQNLRDKNRIACSEAIFPRTGLKFSRPVVEIIVELSNSPYSCRIQPYSCRIHPYSCRVHLSSCRNPRTVVEFTVQLSNTLKNSCSADPARKRARQIGSGVEGDITPRMPKGDFDNCTVNSTTIR